MTGLNIAPFPTANIMIIQVKGNRYNSFLLQTIHHYQSCQQQEVKKSELNAIYTAWGIKNFAKISSFEVHVWIKVKEEIIF